MSDIKNYIYIKNKNLFKVQQSNNLSYFLFNDLFPAYDINNNSNSKYILFLIIDLDLNKINEIFSKYIPYFDLDNKFKKIKYYLQFLNYFKNNGTYILQFDWCFIQEKFNNLLYYLKDIKNILSNKSIFSHNLLSCFNDLSNSNLNQDIEILFYDKTILPLSKIKELLLNYVIINQVKSIEITY